MVVGRHSDVNATRHTSCWTGSRIVFDDCGRAAHRIFTAAHSPVAYALSAVWAAAPKRVLAAPAAIRHEMAPAHVLSDLMREKEANL